MSTQQLAPSSPNPARASSPGPAVPSNGKQQQQQAARASLAGVRGSPAPHSPIPSPRPTGMIGMGRPSSELLQGGAAAFQTPEESAIDQWFENLQHYEATLEEMAAASLDVNFKEELSAIEQWFRVLSEAERTAALYSLLQHSTQVQIRFFVTVLQHMARADPMTALLSPAFGGSMQDQMDAKLKSMGLKSPALKTPASPNPRSFSSQQQRASMDASTFLSAENAPTSPIGPIGGDAAAAATLAQQRAKLKANRISAPVMLNNGSGERSASWGSPLGQVAERGPSPVPSDGGVSNRDGSTSPAPPGSNSSARPKSTDFTGVASSFSKSRLDVPLEDQLSPMIGGNWASMSNTPIVPIFGPKSDQVHAASLDAATAKLHNLSLSNTNPSSRVVLDDARKFRRNSRTNEPEGEVQVTGRRNVSGSGLGGPGWANNLGGGSSGLGVGGLRSPALSNAGSNRFGGSDHGDLQAAQQALAFANMNMSGMGSPALAAAAAMNPMMAAQLAAGGFNPLLANQMNMGMMNPAIAAQFGTSPEAIFAAQMGWNAAASQLGMGGGGRGGRVAGGMVRKGPGSAAGGSTRGATEKKDEDEVDPALLNDIPAWLRSLRLHKYTPNFEGMNWRDMVVLDEAALEAKGVAALGARRKMLKTFENVRAKMGV
ncbi:hypothetical protein AURDEDRAFT_116208 [Auricularia subglabra TFB-10046 SS5]|nr:hypothetical protein AURDEDRAFT_116208 [Auricularia subglabra TFB-10046 SS5]